jgi:hypothetical protein
MQTVCVTCVYSDRYDVCLQTTRAGTELGSLISCIWVVKGTIMFTACSTCVH